MFFLKSNNKGSLFILVSLMLVVLLILSLSFFNFSRAQSVKSDFLLNKQLIDNLQYVAQDEAIRIIQKSCNNPSSDLFDFFLHSHKDKTQAISLDITQNNISSLVARGVRAEALCQLKIIGFFSRDPDSYPYVVANEGHGILEVHVEIILTKPNLPSRCFESKTYRDFLVSSLIPDREQPLAALKGFNSIFLKPLNVRYASIHQHFNQWLLNDVSVDILSEKQSAYDSHNLLLELEPATIFSKYSLWSSRNLSFRELKQYGFIDLSAKQINVNGIVQSRGLVELDEDFIIKSRGVLIADEISISGSISKADPECFLVLYARKGNISLKTNKRVEAALIALNNRKKSKILVQDSFDIKGLIVADMVEFSNQAALNNSLCYDTVFDKPQQKMMVTVSSWYNSVIIDEGSYITLE